jgi:hypothetical protein
MLVVVVVILRIKFENILSIQFFFRNIRDAIFFVQKYTVGLAQPLCENDVRVTLQAVSRGERARPRGLMERKSESERSH